MLTRTLISWMWSVAVFSLGGVMAVYLDVPRVVMLVPTAVCAVTVWIGLAKYEKWRATWANRTANQVTTTPTVGAHALEA
jgi:hypothetical protein